MLGRVVPLEAFGDAPRFGWRTAFTTRAEASRAIGQYIEGFYNPHRRHSSLGYISPAAFEAKFHADQKEQRMALH